MKAQYVIVDDHLTVYTAKEAETISLNELTPALIRQLALRGLRSIAPDELAGRQTTEHMKERFALIRSGVLVRNRSKTAGS